MIYLFFFLFFTSQTNASQNGITLHTALFIEELYDFNLIKGSFSAIVELLLSVDSRFSAPSEMSTISSSLEKHPFTDITFDCYEQKVLGDTRSIVRSRGDVVTSKQRFQLVSRCTVTRPFPFDIHSCSIRIVSPREPLSEVSLEWLSLPSPIIILSPPYLPLNFGSIKAENCSMNSVYSLSKMGSKTVTHGCLLATFVLSRSILSVIVRYFMPMIATVLLAWTSFFVSRRQLLLRFMILSTATFLALVMSLLFNTLSPSLPNISPSDIWIGITFCTLAIAFLQFFIVSNLENNHTKYLDLAKRSEDVREKSRRRHERIASRKASRVTISMNGRTDREKSTVDAESANSSSFSRLVSEEYHRSADNYSLKAARVDLSFRILYPICYAIGIVLYFTFNLFL